MIQPFLKPQQPPERIVLTVSQLNKQSKQTIENQIGSVWLSGEISNLTKAVSGHWYFSLKDQSAQIRCAMFRFKTQNLRFSPENGDKVIIKGKVTLYEARGEYQIVADYMEPDGQGTLQHQLNLLMQKLRSEGLFDEQHKKALPTMPKRIGVITSATGAAIHDVLNVLERRCPMIPVLIYPSQVQGAAASKSLINALKTAEKRAECDVLLLTRGGGSLEDLWCFNDEKLAEQIFHCQIPLVAAVGHEVDTTIAELVADLRAPTPSAAAELLVPEQNVLQQNIDNLTFNLTQVLQSKVDKLQTQLNVAQLKLSNPANLIASNQYQLTNTYQKLISTYRENTADSQKQLDQLSRKLDQLNPINELKANQQRILKLKYQLFSEWQGQFEKLNNQLKITASSLDTLSPLSTLSRGYSIVREPESKKIINRTSQLSIGQTVDLLLSDGEANCTVKKIESNN
ncbi:exodeoxyribonuclease VII large subunit [Aliikangiella sp. IMCC44359]|uniref:exodeoxyribonuclease VII large subunit n=1 Tax=Aliikangiella sp. IMCC44359 TaxID=3459125 RepID=UPI00403B2AF9